MKYIVFFISCLLLVITVLNVITLNVNYSDLSRFGAGYFTGIIIILIVFSTTAFLSGKKIWKRFADMEV